MVDGLWSQPEFSFDGRFYHIENAISQPKPLRRPRPTIYAGGESDTARDLISNLCDAYVMHGDPPERIRRRIEDMTERRERTGKTPMTYGVAAYAIVRDSADEAQREVARITDVKQSAAATTTTSNGSPAPAGTARLARRLFGLEPRTAIGTGRHAGAGHRRACRNSRMRASNLFLLQCSPQLEEMERFARQVIEPYRRRTAPVGDAHDVLPAALSEGVGSW